MRTVIRWLLRIVFLLVLSAACGTFIPRPLIAPVEASSAAVTHRILLLSSSIHTDIAIPLDAETRAAFSFLDDTGFPLGHPNAEWLIIGWGGRAFYLETPTWAELKPLPVLRALTIDRSVLHVDLAGHITEPRARSCRSRMRATARSTGSSRPGDTSTPSSAATPGLPLPCARLGPAYGTRFHKHCDCLLLSTIEATVGPSRS